MRAQSVTFTGTNSTVASLPATFWGVAVDNAGTVYIAYSSAQIMKVTAQGVQTKMNAQHNACSVAFNPLFPGLRMGAVVLYDGSAPANALAKLYISGVGVAPMIGFGPGMQSLVTADLSRGDAVAFDSAGNALSRTPATRVS